MLHMCNNRAEIQILKWVRNLICVFVHGDIQQSQDITESILMRTDMNFNNSCLFAIRIMTITIYILYHVLNNVLHFLICLF